MGAWAWEGRGSSGGDLGRGEGEAGFLQLPESGAVAEK